MQLRRDVELCTRKHSLLEGQLCSPKQLAEELTGRGHTVTLHTSAGGGSGVAA